VIQPSLSRTRLDGLAPEFVSHAKTACAGWQDGDLIDITRAMGRLTFDIVGESIVGARVGHLFDDVRLAVDRATASLDPLISLMAPLSRVGPARRQLRTIVGSLIAARTNGRQDGSLLAHVAPGGDPGLVEQHIDDLLTILLAGHDTLTSALTWAWLLLARHDDARARMLEELSEVTMDGDATPDLLPSLTYTRAVFAETLRLYPPAWVLAREAVESHRFEEGEVPAGAIVLVSQYLLHRDARYFDRPRAFDPGRWLVESPERARSPFFPFGAGSRSCIGESLAWMEGVLILATIAKRWNLRAVGHELPAIDARITLRPASPVMMRVEASSPGR
jgi:cytochrome P450